MHALSAFAPDSIRDHFLADHRRLDAIMARLLRAFQVGDREQVANYWSEFDAGLCAHLEAEEKFLLPVILTTHERDARIIIQEHKHIRARLVELGIAVDLHVIRIEDARNFVAELQAHAHHEDSVLYGPANVQLDPVERTSIFAALADSVKRRARRQPSTDKGGGELA